MKKKIEQIIDQLEKYIDPDKWVGTVVTLEGAFAYPVLLGDVLKAIGRGGGKDKLQLVRLWEDCDESKSLQEIFGPGCEWEELTCAYKAQYGVYCDGCEERQEPKDPAKKALAELLIKLFSND